MRLVGRAADEVGVHITVANGYAGATTENCDEERKASGIEALKDNGRLRNAALTIDDHGLIARILPAIAKEDGSTADAYVGLAMLGIAGFSPRRSAAEDGTRSGGSA